MDLEEIKDKFEKNFDLFMKECKHVSLWGFGIIGFLLVAFEKRYNTSVNLWLFIIALLFITSLFINMMMYHERVRYWYNIYKNKTKNFSKPEDSTQAKKTWENASIVFTANCMGYFLLFLGFITKAFSCDNNFIYYFNVFCFVIFVGIIGRALYLNKDRSIYSKNKSQETNP